MFLNMIHPVSYRVVYASEPISILSESFVATMICWWSSMTNEMLGCLVVCFDSFWDKLRVFKFEKMLPCYRMKTQWNAVHHFSISVPSLVIVKISLQPQYSPIQISFCENTFGHVLGNEVIHRIRFHHIFEFLFFIQFIDFRKRSR